MNINIKSTNLELTPRMRKYIMKQMTGVEKLFSRIEEKGGEVNVAFEVAKSTNHHKAGAVFHADCLINVKGKKFYSSSDQEDIFQAIDEVKDSLFREISKNKERTQTLFKRGATSVKKMMKGLSKRNPFTSKY